MSRYISRSTFLKGMAAVAAGLAAANVAKSFVEHPTTFNSELNFPRRLLGPSMSVGHRIRNGEIAALLQSSSEIPARKVEVAIIGAGVAGLSAAWWLKKQGCSDFVILELEKQAGGNSTAGKNACSAFPWGAHYIPLANLESTYVRQFFQEEGIIERFDEKGQPVYNELYLCHEPQERLFKDGIFSEGLVPKRGLQATEKDDLEKFFHIVHEYRTAIGSDGKAAFAIPLEQSSQDPKWTGLDQMSMADWLAKNEFHSKPLKWYIDYCCRDDYGALSENISAWAGLHYFAGRRGTAANAEMNSVVTWPEGNGFVVERLKQRVNDHLLTDCPVVQVTAAEHMADTVISCLKAPDKVERIAAKRVIYCAPRFLAPYIISEYKAPYHASQKPVYSPWIVSNLTVNRVPAGRGIELCWDNVDYRSPSLGYVVANHQDITTGRNKLVLTYYRPLAERDPSAARKSLSSASVDDWARLIASDLEHMHPGITNEILSMDIWTWGHGMITPVPGYIWGQNRRRLANNHGNVYFAHSDMSGISNFEEAQFRGVEAAKQILSSLGIKSS